MKEALEQVAVARSVAPPFDRETIERAAGIACGRIAPLWPLKNFVAVNPFLGFAGQSFTATCSTLHRVGRVQMLMPRAFYREARARGTIEPGDVERALGAAPPDWRVPQNVADFDAAIARETGGRSAKAAVVPTVAEVLDSLASGNRTISGTGFMIDEISRFCAAYFDEGQAVWRLPSRGLRPYAAWRTAMRHDRNPEVMGVSRFRSIVASLPDDPIEAIAEVVRRQGVPRRALADYLHQALLDIGGWAAYARYLVWNNALYGRDDDTLVHLLAIRVVWGYTLFAQHENDAFTRAWARAMEDAALPPLDDKLGDDPEFIVDLLAHWAYEYAFQRRFLAVLAQPKHAHDPSVRPAFQAAFCIDVRSEVFRRALESVAPDGETLGFAGFFGFPIEYIPIGHVRGGAQCPVLLTPVYTVCETVRGATDEEDTEILGLRLLRRRAAKAWKSFKLSAISSFIFVETAGLLFASKIVSDTLGLTRTVHDPNTEGLDEAVIGRLGPRTEMRVIDGRRTGFDDRQAVDQAEEVLRAMSLTSRFARIVLMTGHGSTTVNNPHASSLDCGACGGHTGEANARVAAAILNEPAVRDGLRARGIDIPEDTWFVGALHDTTTDAVRLFDLDGVPASHGADVDELARLLARATEIARRERAPALRIPPGADLDRAIVARSRDWSQVRPEWGLAGNAAFIAAPRFRTRGIDLGGRAFLHDYDWRADRSFAILELIMTAPMVVASWINLQYYGSTVNNRVFGSGNKVLHNVCGMLGVLEGNAGDLKVGLPWQSVHDGERFMHEPVRLNVFVEAPLDAISAVIANHTMVRDLVENRWLFLFAIDDDGRVSHRYDRGRWEPIA
jgi:uncharacterized protein YbcC (UPF0753/DUF2309 family)